MPDHKPLPVAGYTDQPQGMVDLVNQNKIGEERILRLIDALAGNPTTDKRHVALARTHIETGFMWLNRAIFRPERVALPED